MAVVLEFEGSIEKLSSKMRQTKQDLEGIAEGYERIGNVEKDIVGGAAQNQEKLANSSKKASAGLKQQQGIIESLEAHLKRLETGQRKANNIDTIKKYNSEIAKTKAALEQVKTVGATALDGVNKGANASQAIFGSLKATLISTFAPLFAAGAIFEGIKAVISSVAEFEQSAADLSAITGATGKDLEYLKQQAVEVGVETTISAGKTLEAYKLIASAKPELLSNTEALAGFTREVITLAEATGDELPQVSQDLVDIMNQFGAGSGEVSRFTNALAAGSKEGSAEVRDLAASALASGAALKSSNVQIEESIALLEGMAEKGIKGAEAGTALRNVALKLSATDILPKEAIQRLEAAGVNIDQLSDKNLKFTDRLRALLPIQNDANALVSVFGLENQAAAQILIGQIDRVDELTAAVTDTNVAQEQAAVRTATASAEWERLKNTIQSVIQGNGDGLGTFLAFLIRFVREGILFLKAKIDDLKPTFQLVIDSFSRLFDAIGNILGPIFQTSEGFDIMGTAVKLLNIPIKVVLTLFSYLVDAATAVYTWFGNLIKTSPGLNKFFGGLRNIIAGAFLVLQDLPAYVDGALSAIKVFVTETAKAIGQLGRNIGSVLYEAFNFKNLVSNGTDDLFAAVDKLLVNPFKDVGKKSRAAFDEGFRTSKATAAKVQTTTPDIANPGAPGEVISTQSFSRDDEQNKKDAEKAAREAEKAAKEAAQKQKEYERLKLEAMADGKEKAIALENAKYTDLKSKLDEYGIATEEATAQHELNLYEIKRKFIEQTADLDSLSGEERIRFIYEQSKKEIDALEAALKNANGGALGDDQVKQLNLLRKTANDQFLKDMEAFQTEEQTKAQDHEIALLELKADSFKTQADFEEFKEKEILNIRLKYAEAALALIEQQKGAQSDAALSLRKTINDIKRDMENISKQGAAKEFNLWSLLGLDPSDPENAKVIKGVEDAAKTSIDILSQVNKARLDAADSAIEASNKEIDQIQKEIDEKQKELDKQIERDELGYANRQIETQREIDLLKAQQEAEKVERDKAFKEKQKIQKQQAIIDSITQASSLITASAQIFQSVAAIPFVGPVLGAALVAAMIGSFVAAKVKVFQSISKQKAEKGMTGIVRGKRHSEGGEAFGDHIEVEDGEAFGVLSRPATRKFGNMHAAFVNALNKNKKAEAFDIASRLLGRPNLDGAVPQELEQNEAKVIQMRNEVHANLQSEGLNKNNALLEEVIKKDRAPKTEFLADGSRVERHGTNTRIIKKRRA